jgi:hypothetical protein
MGTKVREKEYLSVVNNTKKGYNSDLSSDCGKSFANHPEGFFIFYHLLDLFSLLILIYKKILIKMAKIKLFEEWFWDKKTDKEKEEEEAQRQADAELIDIEEKPFAGGGKLIEVGQDFYKDWFSIIPKYDDFLQITFVSDENTNLTIYKPDVRFLSKDPKHPRPEVEGDENIFIRYDKRDNPHLNQSVLNKMEKDKIIEIKHYMSLIKPEAIMMHCGNLISIVVK